MKLTRPIAVAALGALSCLGLPSSTAVVAGAGLSVHPEPLATGHVLATTLSFPPDTDYCETNIGIACYQPAQFQKAYDLAPLFARGLDGAGRTIIIVDSFGSPTIQQDLTTFDNTFNLPAPPHFDIIQPAGAVPAYPQDPFGSSDRSGWAVETTLDVEYAHTMAPGANILLVETPTSETEGVQGFPEIVKAETYVIDHHMGDVISQSFSATEQTFPTAQSLLDMRSAVLDAQKKHVTLLAGTGDSGSTSPKADLSCCYTYPVVGWPASDPLVTAVGGTQLHLDENGDRTAPDSVWNDGDVFGPDAGAGAGGVSVIFNRPSFQDGVAGVTGPARGVPDISLSAAVNGAAVFYYSFCDYSRNDPHTGQPPLCGPQWHLVGGTSEASPLLAGIVAIGAQANHHSLGFLNPLLYSSHVAPAIVDVTSGDNTYVFCSANCGQDDETDVTVPGYAAGPGYDLASGLGTLDAAKFVAAVAHPGPGGPGPGGPGPKPGKAASAH